MRAQIHKRAPGQGASAALRIIYGELKERARLLRQAVREGDQLNESFEELVPESDAVSAQASSRANSKAAH
jgi:hypothetical protein